MTTRRFLLTVTFALSAALAVPAARPSAQQPGFPIEETAIARIHAAMKAKRLTCRALAEAYLERIGSYDRRGPALNAIVVLNLNALNEAGALDRRFAQAGLTGPLHCVPAIVKDDFETIGLQSADGSLSLEGFVSNWDAFAKNAARRKPDAPGIS